MNDGKILIGAHQLSWGASSLSKGIGVTSSEVINSRIEKAKELGCGAFEVFLSSNFGPAPAVKKAAEKAGLTTVGCAIIRDGVDGDPLSTDGEIRKGAEEAIEYYIESTCNIGGTLLGGPLVNVLGRKDAHYPTEDELKAGVRTFCNVAKVAKEKGIKIAIEPLQWSEMPWPNTVKQVLDFIELVEKADDVPKNVLGVLFDIYHALRMEENWIEALKMMLEKGKLFHMHIAGPNRTPPRINQHINWKFMIDILKSAKWDGTITIESFGEECDLPFAVVGPGERLPAEQVISTGVETLREAGLE